MDARGGTGIYDPTYRALNKRKYKLVLAGAITTRVEEGKCDHIEPKCSATRVSSGVGNVRTDV